MSTNITESNAWVFLSHSNKDFDKLVPVRNKLEELNYRPLLFFLKCLDDHTETMDLIKREIDARERFILCESSNSRASDWVKEEVAYIKNTGRPYEVINLEASDETIERCICRFDQRSSLYIWSTEDVVAEKVAELSLQKAFKVNALKGGGLQMVLSDLCVGEPLREFRESDVLKGAYFLALVSRELKKEEASFLNGLAKRCGMNAVAYMFSNSVAGSNTSQVPSTLLEYRCDGNIDNNTFWNGLKDDIFRKKTIDGVVYNSVAEKIVKDLMEWDSKLFNGETIDVDFDNETENREPENRRKIRTRELLDLLRNNYGLVGSIVPMVHLTPSHEVWLQGCDLRERSQNRYLNILDTPRFMDLINHHARRKGLSYPNVYVCDDLEVLFWAFEDLVNNVSAEAQLINDLDKHRSTISAFGYFIQHLLEANGIIP